jgi:hypothetical protein
MKTRSTFFSLTVIMVMLATLVFQVTPAFAATQSIGGTATLGNLRVDVYDNGAMAIGQYTAGGWQENIFGVSAKGSTLCVATTRYDMGGNSTWSPGAGGTAAALVSNTGGATGSGTLVTTWTAGGMTIVQTTSYTDGNQYYTIEWAITNTSGGDLNDLRLFHGQDTLLAGSDQGNGWWNAGLGAFGSIGVTHPTNGQQMWLQTVSEAPFNYESRVFYTSRLNVNNCALDGTVTATTVDNGYALEFRHATLANGATWNVTVEEHFIPAAPSNSAPVADNDAYNTPMGTLLNGATVLTGDTDADNDPLTAIQVMGPKYAASFTFNSDGTFAYTPANGFSGDDAFTYKANDGTADSNTATVTITVGNNAPTALTLSNRFIQEERPAGWLIGTLAGTDADLTDALTYSLVSTVSCDGTDNGYFAVDGSNLEASATPIDYQTKYFLSVCVRATDLGDLTFDQQFTVVVRSLHHFPMDMNGDGTDDYVTFRPSTGTWHLRNSPPIVSFGQNGDLPVGADYNGDGKSDIAVFRPARTATWHIRGQATPINFGTVGDVPLPVDFNGDGKADIAVFRPSTSTWHIRGQLLTLVFGKSGDIPVPADYNGDGKAELAIFRPSDGTWQVQNQPSVSFGQLGDIPVAYDYNGDGKADMAVYRPSTGVWHIRNIGTITHGGFYDMPFPMFMNGAVRYVVIHAGPVAIEWQGFGMPTITFGANDDSHQ